MICPIPADDELAIHFRLSDVPTGVVDASETIARVQEAVRIVVLPRAVRIPYFRADRQRRSFLP